MAHDAFDPYHKWLGIPPHEQPPNYYRLLGLSPLEDDPEVIDRAADARMIVLRNAQLGPHYQWSQVLQAEVTAARMCLLDANAKRRYDTALTTPPHTAYEPEPPETLPAEPPAAMIPARSAPAPFVPHVRRSYVRSALRRHARRPSVQASFLVGVLGGLLGLVLGYAIAFKAVGFDPLNLGSKIEAWQAPASPGRRTK